MKAKCHGQSDVGKVRKLNEDYILLDPALEAYILCDGVGGHAAGNVASESCAKTVHSYLLKNRSILEAHKKTPGAAGRKEIAALLQAAIEAANKKINDDATADKTKTGMSTTINAVIFANDHVIVGHVGDSRAYLIRKGRAHKLTEDHKVSVDMRKSGWTDEEIARSPYANVLTRAVGIQKFVQVDILQLEVSDGDKILMCSDGLSDYLSLDEIAPEVEQNPGAQGPAFFVDLAKKRGGKDNISVIMMEIEGIAAGNQPIDALKKSDLLGKVPLFRFFDYAEVIKMLGLMTTRTYKKGETLFHEGSISQELFVIADGKVEVKKGAQLVAQLGKGQVFGEMGIFDNAPRSASVVAQDGVVALVATRRDLMVLLRKETQLTIKLLWALNLEMNRRLRDTTEELAALRESLVEDNDPDTALDLPFPVPPSADDASQDR